MAIEKDLLDQLLAGRNPKDVFNKDGLVDELKKALSRRQSVLPAPPRSPRARHHDLLFQSRLRRMGEVFGARHYSIGCFTPPQSSRSRDATGWDSSRPYARARPLQSQDQLANPGTAAAPPRSATKKHLNGAEVGHQIPPSRWPMKGHATLSVVGRMCFGSRLVSDPLRITNTKPGPDRHPGRGRTLGGALRNPDQFRAPPRLAIRRGDQGHHLSV